VAPDGEATRSTEAERGVRSESLELADMERGSTNGSGFVVQ